MTNAERQARHRAARATARPVIRYRRAADHRSHAQRWRDPVADFSRAEFPVRRLFLGLPRPEFLA